MNLKSAPLHHAFMQTIEQNHLAAADIHEKASKHHHEAARLHHLGDFRQALVHADVAADHAKAALETGALTLGP